MENYTLLLFMCFWGMFEEPNNPDDLLHRMVHIVNILIPICIDRFNLYDNWFLTEFFAFLLLYIPLAYRHYRGYDL